MIALPPQGDHHNDEIDGPGTAATARRPGRGRLLAIAALAIVGLVAAACSDDTDDALDQAAAAAEDAGADDAADGVDADEIDEQAAALADVLRDNDMATLASAVEQVDLGEVIGSEEFTFFGPNDEAFLALTADETADLLADPAQLADVLRNHAVDQRITSTDLAGMDSVTTIGGESLDVVVDGDTVTVGGAAVVTADLDAGGGVVHVIDQVLLP